VLDRYGKVSATQPTFVVVDVAIQMICVQIIMMMTMINDEALCDPEFKSIIANCCNSIIARQ